MKTKTPEEIIREYHREISSRGGKARLKTLSKKRRSEIARNAVMVRWNKHKKGAGAK